MRIAIIEDLQQDSERLIKLLKEYMERYDFALQMECFGSGEEFLDAVEPEKFDLCFMDIYMDGISGVETAEKLREKDPRCLVIFLTSSPDFMAEGYRLRAWRYLLKPVDMESICEAMDECIAQVELSKRRLNVMIGRQEVSLPFSKIYYVATANRSIEIHGKDTTLTTNTHVTFEKLTAPLLNDYRFFCVGKGLVVNLQFVIQVEENCAVMTNGDRLPISRRKRSEVSAALVQFQFTWGGGGVINEEIPVDFYHMYNTFWMGASSAGRGQRRGRGKALGDCDHS